MLCINRQFLTGNLHLPFSSAIKISLEKMWCSLWLWKILECNKRNRCIPPRNELVPFILLQNMSCCVGRNCDHNATNHSLVDCNVIFCGSILPIVFSPWYVPLWRPEFWESLKLRTINFYNLVRKRAGFFCTSLCWSSRLLEILSLTKI